MQGQESAPPVPARLVPLLDRVLKGEAPLEAAERELELDERTLGILLRALIRERAGEQRWELSD